MTEPDYRIITPDQLAHGYVIAVNGRPMWRCEWRVVRQMEDGNYLVHEPRPLPHDDFHHTPRCNTGGCHD